MDAVFVSVNAPISLNSTMIAPVMAGIANKNANLAAHTLSTPENSPADIEEPDREIPGNSARDSNIPMTRAFLKEIPFIFLFPRFTCSALQSMIPLIIRKMLTAGTLL